MSELLQIPLYKKCTKCKKDLLLISFHKQTGCRFGVRPNCKQCKLEVDHRHYLNNSEKIIARRKQYYQNNLEKCKEAIKRSLAKYIPLHIEELRERSRNYYHQNKDLIKERSKFHNENPELLRIRQLKTYGLSLEQYSKLVIAQQNKCPICLESLDLVKQIHIDHDHSCCKNDTSCGRCVRGILCSNCNKALGFLRDNAISAIRSALYLNGLLNSKSDILKTIGEIK